MAGARRESQAPSPPTTSTRNSPARISPMVRIMPSLDMEAEANAIGYRATRLGDVRIRQEIVADQIVMLVEQVAPVAADIPVALRRLERERRVGEPIALHLEHRPQEGRLRVAIA